jgi:uncharacterized membrane protein
MENPPPGQTSKSSTGLDENIAALLSYVFGWVSGLVFFLIEKNSRFVRFHAMQSLILSGGFGIIMFILWFVAVVLSLIVGYASNLLGSLVWLLAMLLISVISIGVLIGWIMCLIKAFNKEYFKLPFIGNYAEKFSAK